MKDIKIILLILTSLLFLQNCFAEINAINITIKNVSSGEIIYQKIIPNNEYFQKIIYIGKYTINITIDPNYSGNSVSTSGYNWIFHQSPRNTNIVTINNIGVYIYPIEYNFNKNTTKAPIPLNVYLLIIAFFTYILSKKPKI
ncbi:hypothetical protein ACO3TA_06990 [Methanocaldococcus sp. 28A]